MEIARMIADVQGMTAIAVGLVWVWVHSALQSVSVC